MSDNDKHALRRFARALVDLTVDPYDAKDEKDEAETYEDALELVTDDVFRLIELGEWGILADGIERKVI